MTIFVAIWACATRSTQPVQERVANLHAALATAYSRYTTAQIPKQNQKVCAIFLAPEYFMSAPRANFVDAKGLMEDQRDEIVSSVRQVGSASHFKGFLIVPGTIAYKKHLVRPASQMRKVDPSTGQRTGTLKTTSRADKALNAFDNSWSIVCFKDSRFAGVPGSFMETVGVRRAKFKSDADLFKISGPLLSFDEPMIFKNVAYVFLDGQIVHKYSKQADFFETLGDPNVHFIPGGSSCVKDIQGIRFSFEICMDHSLQVAQAAQTHYRDHGVMSLAQPSDIHIILSDFTSSVYSPTRNGGFVLHASTNSANSGVFYKDMKGTLQFGAKVEKAFERLERSDKKVDSFELRFPLREENEPISDKVNGFELRYWLIHLDK